jgi:hypothetical protein
VVGEIDTGEKQCAGSAMANGCNIWFPARSCFRITLRAVMDDAEGVCGCPDSEPNSIISGVSAW